MRAPDRVPGTKKGGPGFAAARGLYPQADLVIAEEPTAALDARAEERLFSTFPPPKGPRCC